MLMPAVFTVTERVEETKDIFTIKLIPNNQKDRHDLLPGQFAMLQAFGIGEAPISYSGYSLQNEEIVHTIEELGSVTTHLARLKVGDEVGVRGPYGTVWPLEAAKGKSLVIVAGGIGLAPIRPIIQALALNRNAYNDVWLLAGARSQDKLLYLAELKQLAQLHDINFITTLDQAADGWQGKIGTVTDLFAQFEFSSDSYAFICGPEGMIKASAVGLINKGLAAENVFVSLERNMQCAVGQCGHCLLGPVFVCKDGPVLSYKKVEPFINIEEI